MGFFDGNAHAKKGAVMMTRLLIVHRVVHFVINEGGNGKRSWAPNLWSFVCEI